MKELVKQYLDRGITRRKLMSGLTAVGMTTVAAKAMAQSLTPAVAGATDAAVAPAAVRTVKGTGGALFVQQLKAAGVKFVFFNPSTGDSPIFDALVDEPAIQLIKGIQEGAVASMADGYARASGKPGVIVVANIGLPNALTPMINTYKDQVPLVVAVASLAQGQAGAEAFQEADHVEDMTSPITKWHWTAESTSTIPDTLRRGLKFATTPPCGPVFLSLPQNLLAAEATATIVDGGKFDVPMRIRPDQRDVERAARMLIEAKDPLISVGDEVAHCDAGPQVVALAEVLGIPVAGQAGALGYGTKPFPTRHPLYIGALLREMRFPAKSDLLLNLGNRYGEIAAPGRQLISVRHDPTSLARVAPVDLGMVADLQLATADLIEAVKSLATAARLKAIAAERFERTAKYSAAMRGVRQKIVDELADRSPISLERLAMELEAGLDKDTIYVADCDSGKTMDPLMSFGGDDKRYIGTGPAVFGWGIGAAMGVKLAKPDSPVVSVLGDGSFLFGGPQPLWSLARYSVPIPVIVLNNRSYNNERNRIWNSGGRQFKAGRDMTCYLGSPDVDYVKAAGAFGVEGEAVTEPGQVKDALARAKRAAQEGRPYLLDVLTARDGIGAASTWHPPYSLAEQRTRKV